jgi:alcohol dehydrogenase class IV
LSQTSRYDGPTELLSGPGSLAGLPEEMRRLSGSRAIVVSDAGLAKAGIVERIERGLGDASLLGTSYLDVPAGPTFADVDAVVARIRAENIDTVVSVGSGSVLAVGRSAALVATHDASSSRSLAGVNKSSRPPLLSICVPTTAGSGGEVSRQATLTDDEGHKAGIQGRDVAARLAILDAELLLTVPRRQAVDSGIDALTHALEAYVSRRASPLTDALALSAFGTIFDLLPAALTDREVTAWDRLLLASTMANLACGNAGLGLVHGLNKGITYLFHTGRYAAVPYGELHAVLLPWVVRFNLPAAPQRFATLARAMGVDGEGSDEAIAEAGVDRLASWMAGLGAPRRLPWTDVPPADDLDVIATDVLGRAMARDNPRDSTAEDLNLIVRQSVAGW